MTNTNKIIADALLANIEAALEIDSAVARDCARAAHELTHVLAAALGDDNLDNWEAGRDVGRDAVSPAAARMALRSVVAKGPGNLQDAVALGLIAGGITRAFGILGG